MSNGHSPSVSVGLRENLTFPPASNSSAAYSTTPSYGFGHFGPQSQEPLLRIPPMKMNGFIPTPTGSMTLRAPAIDPTRYPTNHAVLPAPSNTTHGTISHVSEHAGRNERAVPPVGMATLFGDWCPPSMPLANGPGSMNVRTGETTGPIAGDQMNGWLERNGTRHQSGMLPSPRDSVMSVPYSTMNDDNEEVLEIDTKVAGDRSVPPVGPINGYVMTSLRNQPTIQGGRKIGHRPGETLDSPGRNMSVKRLIGAQELQVFFPSVEQRRQVSLGPRCQALTHSIQFRHYVNETVDAIVAVRTPKAQNPWRHHFAQMALGAPHGSSIAHDAFRLGILSLASFDMGFRESGEPAEEEDNALYAASIGQRTDALKLLRSMAVLKSYQTDIVAADLAIGTAVSLCIRDVSTSCVGTYSN